MTECNQDSIPFASTKRRNLLADFSGGVITSDAGALLLRQADRQLGLLDALDRVIPDPRNPEFILHPQRALLAQRIFGIACGYEDLNDHQQLRDDPLWQTATDHPGSHDLPELASPPTLCRLENRIQRRTLLDIAVVLVEKFIQAHATPPEELILDFDATELERAIVGTIRLKLFKIGAWVKRSVRRLVVKMASSYPWQLLIRTVAARLATSGSSPAFSP